MVECWTVFNSSWRRVLCPFRINTATLPPEQRRSGTFLYGLLASLLKNRPLPLLKGIQRGNGFEAVRQLFKTCQPSSRNRALGLLHLLMKWPEFDMKVAMVSQVLRLEDWFRESERIGGNLSEELKFAIVMKCIALQGSWRRIWMWHFKRIRRMIDWSNPTVWSSYNQVVEYHGFRKLIA